jgi:hypothetical protein
MQRLASEENWQLFTDPSPAPGIFGDYLYYMSGPALIAQKPTLYLELSDDGSTWSATNPATGKIVAAAGVVNSYHGTTDNSSTLYQETRKVRGKVQRKTTVRTPQTPTQVRFAMISGALEFCAGQVAVEYNAGPDNGRWIIEDVTHNLLGDLPAQFTLGPSTLPYPEPQAGTVASLGPNVSIPSTSTPASPASPGAPSTNAVGGGPTIPNLGGISTTLTGHPEVKPGIARIVNAILQAFPGLVITATTNGNHVANSYHYLGEAVDLASGDYALMDSAAAWIAANLSADLTEGIHNPGSSPTGMLSVENGQAVPSSFWGASTWAGHANHIHVACAGAQSALVLNPTALTVQQTSTAAANAASNVTQTATGLAGQAAASATKAAAGVAVDLGGIFTSVFDGKKA